MSTELPVATRHHRDMTEKLLKATLNKQTNKQFQGGGGSEPVVDMTEEQITVTPPRSRQLPPQQHQQQLQQHYQQQNIPGIN